MTLPIFGFNLSEAYSSRQESQGLKLTIPPMGDEENWKFFNLLETCNKGKNLRHSGKPRHITYRGINKRITVDFLLETVQVR